jgi:hypothetical protein
LDDGPSFVGAVELGLALSFVELFDLELRGAAQWPHASTPAAGAFARLFTFPIALIASTPPLPILVGKARFGGGPALIVEHLRVEGLLGPPASTSINPALCVRMDYGSRITSALEARVEIAARMPLRRTSFRFVTLDGPRGIETTPGLTVTLGVALDLTVF